MAERRETTERERRGTTERKRRETTERERRGTTEEEWRGTTAREQRGTTERERRGTTEWERRETTEEERREKALSPGSVSSSLTGLPGLAMLFGGFLLANYVGAFGVGAFLLLFFLLCFASAFWSRGVCRRVLVDVEAPMDACCAGQEFSLKIRIQNRSFFPLVWLDVLFPTGARELVRRTEEDEAAWFCFPGQEKPQTGLRQRFVWLLWHQEIAWEEELTAMRRGVLRFGQASLQAGDGFGLSVFDVWRRLPRPVCVYLFPAPVPVRMDRFLRVTQEAVARSRGETEDITLLKSSRPYQPGDPAKRINWRLLAASGQMMVNLYETVQPGCAAFVLDLGSFRRIVEHRESQVPTDVFLMRDSLEDMIAVIATCMRELTARRIPVALLIPAYGVVSSSLCLPADGETGLRSCLEALAQVEYRAQVCHVAEEELWRLGRSATSLYFCVGTDEKNELEEQAALLGSGRVTFLASRKRGAGFGTIPCLYLSEVCPAAPDRREKDDEQIS